MNIYLIVITVSLIGAFAVNAVAEILNIRFLDPGLPEEFADVFDQDRYQASQNYARDNARLDLVSSAVSLVVILGFIFLDGFTWMDSLVRGAGLGPIPTGLLFIAVLALLSDLASIPFQVYRVFVLEARYGFNTMTLGTYLADKIKGYALALVVGGPLVAAVLFFFREFGPQAWLFAWLLTVAVSAGLQYLAPKVILPLFNRFSPMQEGEMRKAIEDYVQSQDYKVKDVYVIDGSRRTTKGNAFFAGLGATKRVALYDNLVRSQDKDEITAVIAHEVGHYKMKHIVKGFVIAAMKTGLLFFLLQMFISSPGLYEAFGMRTMPVYAGLVFFLILYTPVSLALGVLFNAATRSFEFQADRFAAETTGNPLALVRALKKLSADNLANLTPHPFFVALNYSHPPILKRIAAIKSLE